MRPHFLTALLLAPTAALAGTVSVFFADAEELNPREQGRVVRAVEVAMAEWSGLVAKSAAPPVENSRCGDEAWCLAALVGTTGADFGVVLHGRAGHGGLSLGASFVDVARKEARHGEFRGRLDEPEGLAKALARQLTPAFARKGWSGLLVDAPKGGVVRVDGKAIGVTPLDRPLAITAGPHEVDVVYPNGNGVLHRALLPDASPLRVDAKSALPEAVTGIASRTRNDVPVLVSYGLFDAGALSMAGALVAGGLWRNAAHQLTACAGGSLSCDTLADAQLQQHRAEVYARNGNALWVTGGALLTAGVGLFITQALLKPETR